MQRLLQLWTMRCSVGGGAFDRLTAAAKKENPNAVCNSEDWLLILTEAQLLPTQAPRELEASSAWRDTNDMSNSQHNSGSQPYQTLSSNQEEACNGDGPQNAGREDAALSTCLFPKSAQAEPDDISPPGEEVSNAVSDRLELSAAALVAPSDGEAVASKSEGRPDNNSCPNHNAVEPPSSKSVKPLGRKGIERKNFSKQVVDELQAWFYNNISHP
jgi:hypothetical protein